MKPKYETVRAWGYTTEDGSLDAYSQPDKGDLGCHLQVRVIRERDWRLLMKSQKQMLDAIRWALGESPDGCPARQEGQGTYYWRIELRRRAGLLP